jgi:hypothetical protein
MFIRSVTKRNKSSSKKYECQQLVESIRTEKGVRQKLLLSLGRLPIPKDKWPRLTKRIEAIVHNQETLFKETPEIEALANKFAQRFVDRHAIDIQSDKFKTVDVQSLQNHRVRSVGGEYLGVSFFKKLKLPSAAKPQPK